MDRRGSQQFGDLPAEVREWKVREVFDIADVDQGGLGDEGEE
jgi:hypothetical protein